MAIQTFFYFFATPFLKEFIQNKVRTDSEGLYELYFDKLTINFTGNSIYLTGFRLKPNKKLYKEFLRKQKINKPLYEIELTALRIYGINLYESLTHPGLSIESIEIVQPYVKIVDTPDKETVEEKTNRKFNYDVFHEDLYPAISIYFTALSIDQVLFTEGKFDLSLIENKNSISSAEEISIVLENFAIDSVSALMKDRLFFAEKINLKIENYSLFLKKINHRLTIDSIRIITNKEIAIHEIKLFPDSTQMETNDTLKSAITGYIHSLRLLKPGISDIYFKKRIDIEEVLISRSEIEITEPAKKRIQKSKTRTSLEINPYLFIEDYFESVKIRSFVLKDSKIDIDFISYKKPNISIPNYEMKFANFNLDSSSFRRKDNFFYCKDFEFNGNKIRLNRATNLTVSINKLLLSTFRRKFVMSGLFVHSQKKQVNNTEINLPFMTATGVNFRRLYQNNEMIISSLSLNDAEINVNNYKLGSLKRKKEQKKGFDLISYVSAGSINLNNSKIKLNNFKDSVLETKLSLNLTAQLENYTLNSKNSHTLLSKNFMEASDFSVVANNVVFNSKPLNYNSTINKFNLSTKDSIFVINDFNMRFDTAQNSLNKLVEIKNNGFINLYLPYLKIDKFKIQDLLYKKELDFNSMKIKAPDMFFLTYNHLNFSKRKKTQYEIIYKPKDFYIRKFKRLVEFLNLEQKKKKKFKSVCNTGLCAFIDSLKSKPFFNPKMPEIATAQKAEYDTTDFVRLITESSIFKNVKEKFRFIKFNDFEIDNAKLKLTVRDSLNRKAFFFDNTSNLSVGNFDFTPDSIIHNYESLFCDKILLEIDKPNLEIGNSIYKLRGHKFGFRFPENKIYGSNLYIFEQEKNPELSEMKTFYNFVIPEFYISGFNIKKFNRHKEFVLDKIYFKKPNISQIVKFEKIKQTDSTKLNRDKTIGDLLKFTIPKGISSIKFTDLQIDTADLVIANEHKLDRKFETRTRLSLNISDFLLDTLILPSGLSRKNNSFYLDFLTDSTRFDTIGNYNYASNISFSIDNLQHCLPDSIHTLNIDKITFSADTSDLKIKGARITADTSKRKTDVMTYFGSSNQINLNIPEIKIKNINLHKLYYNSQFLSDSIKIVSADANILHFPLTANILNKKINLSELNIFDKINPLLKKIEITGFNINNLNLTLYKHKRQDTMKLKKTQVQISNILIDSLSEKRDKLFYNDEISIKIPGFKHKLSQYYKIKFDSICVNSKKENICLNGFVIKSPMTRPEFVEKKKYQTAMVDFAVSKIDFKNFDFKKLIYKDSLIISSIEIEPSRLHVYKDLRVPIDSARQPPMPLSLLYNAPLPITIDSISLKNLTLKYEERVKGAPEDSRILVENINAKIKDLTNKTMNLIYHDTTTLSVNGKIMGAGYFESNFVFLLDAYKNKYSYKGFIKPFELNLLNDYFSNSVFVKIPQGTLDRLNFNVVANDEYAYGKLKFNYHGLKIEVLDKDVEEGKESRRAMLSLLANGLIKSSNPRYPGTPSRVGQIYFEPNPHKQIFNYWVLSLLSGVKSTMGFNSRQAKKVLKEQRKEIKQMN